MLDILREVCRAYRAAPDLPVAA